MTRRSTQRRGLTLLEVLVSLAIFLIALGALQHLMTLCSDMAMTIHQKSQAARLAQSLLNEVSAGIMPIQSSVQSAEVMDDPDYMYSMASEASVISGLYTVTVTVFRENSNGRRVEYTLAQMMIDPAMVGSNQDQSAIQGQAETPATTETTGTTGTTTGTTGTTTGTTTGATKGN